MAPALAYPDTKPEAVSLTPQQSLLTTDDRATSSSLNPANDPTYFLPTPSPSSLTASYQTPLALAAGADKASEQAASGQKVTDHHLVQEQQQDSELKDEASTSSGSEAKAYVRTPSSSGDEKKEESEEKSEEASERESEEASEADSFATDSQTSEPGVTMVGTPLQVRNALKRKMFFIGHKEAKETAKPILDKARAILDRKRGSDWGRDKQDNVLQALADYAEEAEATFVVNFINHMLEPTRKVPKDASEEKVSEEYEWIEKAWGKSHLRTRHQINFRTDGLPSIRTGDTYHDDLIAQVPRVENPRPDLAFGIYDSAFDLLHQAILDNHHCDLAGSRMYDVFLSFDAKCMNAPIDEAENQCIRSGAAMVATRRRLNQAAQLAPKSTQTSFPKPDARSFAFTLAIGSQGANMFVNWALEMHPDKKDIVQWHMHFLRDYSFKRGKEIAQLHHDIDNVLDWGLTKRKAKVEKLCAKIHGLKAMQTNPKKRKNEEPAGPGDNQG